MRGRKPIIQFANEDKHIAEIATLATNMGIYTVESLKGGIYYFCEDDKIVIATSRGYMKTDISTAEILAEELNGIIYDFRTYMREGRKLMDTRSISKMLEV